MRVFYKPSDKTVCELNDARLKMYQRLLRLHEENPEGVHMALKNDDVISRMQPIAPEAINARADMCRIS